MAHAEQLHQAYIQIQCQSLNQLNAHQLNVSLLKLWLERYKQRQLLAELPETLLQDVGISRAEAILESQKSFWQK